MTGYDVVKVVFANRGAKCMDCGTEDIRVMSWDHRSRNKGGSVSTLAKYNDIPQLRTELGQCDPVCLNCHKIRELLRDGVTRNMFGDFCPDAPMPSFTKKLTKSPRAQLQKPKVIEPTPAMLRALRQNGVLDPLPTPEPDTLWQKIKRFFKRDKS